MKIPVKKAILYHNDKFALGVRKLLKKHNLRSFNIMSSPGAGKTSLILLLGGKLPKQFKMGVIEGDLASRIDTDMLIKQGYKAVQINTGGGCHLEAVMIKKALDNFSLNKIHFLFIENVGNLVCPANFDLGTDKNIVISSVTEGDDKPYKYPGMFIKADLVVLNKMDTLKHFDFNTDYFIRGVRLVNSKVPVIFLSCKSGKGAGEIIQWILGGKT